MIEIYISDHQMKIFIPSVYHSQVIRTFCIVILISIYLLTLGMIDHLGPSFNKHLLSTRGVLGIALGAVLEMPFLLLF